MACAKPIARPPRTGFEFVGIIGANLIMRRRLLIQKVRYAILAVEVEMPSLFARVGALALTAGSLLPLPVTEVLGGLSLKTGANSAKAIPPISPPSVTYNPDRNPSAP
jgi:hypothetical protein